MSNLQIFENPEFGKVRTVEIEGEAWLVGKDVAEALGYERATKAIADHVDDEDKDVVPIQDSIGRMQNTPVIKESGVYALVFSSKLPTAKKFKRWVTSEVLPQIRKTGSYQKPLSPEEQMAQGLLAAQKLLEQTNLELTQAKQLVCELQPKATYYDLVLQNKSLLSVTKIAKDYGKSAMWLNTKLHDYGIQFKQGDQWFLYEQLNAVANSKAGETLANAMIKGLDIAAVVISGIINNVMWLGSVIVDNAGVLEPVLMRLGLAFLVIAANSAMAAAGSAAHGVASMYETASILALIIAQEGLNAALYACPLTWILGLIIALVGVFYLAVAAVNYFAGISISATGLIFGAFAWLFTSMLGNEGLSIVENLSRCGVPVPVVIKDKLEQLTQQKKALEMKEDK